MRAFHYALPLDPPVLGHRVRRGLWLVRDDGWRADFAPWPLAQSGDEVSRRFAQGGPERRWAEAHFMPPVRTEPVSAATLLWPGREQGAGNDATWAQDVSGHPAVKLKVRPGDLNTVRDLRARVTDLLRLDGKRTLSVDDARALADVAAPLEFFEEPVAGLDGLVELCRAGVPVALDETVREVAPHDAEALLRRAPFAAVVLKATLLGPRAVEAWLDAARNTDTKVVVSSVFESGLGRQSLHQLARRVAPDVVHGLGTGAFFSQDLFADAPLDSLVPAGGDLAE